MTARVVRGRVAYGVSRVACERAAARQGCELVALKDRGANRYFLVSNDVRIKLGLREAAVTARRFSGLPAVAAALGLI